MTSPDSEHATEVRQGERFAFGANWSRFLAAVTNERVALAVDSLRNMLGLEDMRGLTFLDVGSGSGLFSLAAYQLGAKVHSFDFDPQSTACTRELRRRFAADGSRWTIENGSILDAEFIERLGTFNIVYSWGVLHHTGRQELALANISKLVGVGGMLFIALYNDQGWISRYWTTIKRLYNRHAALRPMIVIAHMPYLLVGRLIVRALTGRLNERRGMSLWYDMIDWLGGWPFEVSRPDDIVVLYESQGFSVCKVATMGRRPGCNEFVFLRQRIGPAG